MESMYSGKVDLPLISVSRQRSPMVGIRWVFVMFPSIVFVAPGILPSQLDCSLLLSSSQVVVSSLLA